MKNKLSKSFIFVALIAAIATGLFIGYSPINAVDNNAKTTTSSVNNSAQVITTPLQIVANPDSFLNKNVKFTAIFDKFSGLGLDYPPAKKPSTEYIGILIKRDDVKDHTVPLSEMKLFMTRKMAEKFVDIDPGDKVSIEGNVFLTALGDPWINISSMTILEQVNKKEKTEAKVGK